MKRTILALGLILSMGGAVLQTGCVSSVGIHATAYPGTLVEVRPGVWVVSGYSEAVFYNNGAYWWWNAGTWYTSSYVDYGYSAARLSVVPSPIRVITQPQVYIDYRGAGASRPIPPGHIRQTYPRGGGQGGGRDEHGGGGGGGRDEHGGGGGGGRDEHGGGGGGGRDDHGGGGRDEHGGGGGQGDGRGEHGDGGGRDEHGGGRGQGDGRGEHGDGGGRDEHGRGGGRDDHGGGGGDEHGGGANGGRGMR